MHGWARENRGVSREGWALWGRWDLGGVGRSGHCGARGLCRQGRVSWGTRPLWGARARVGSVGRSWVLRSVELGAEHAAGHGGTLGRVGRDGLRGAPGQLSRAPSVTEGRHRHPRRWRRRCGRWCWCLPRSWGSKWCAACGSWRLSASVTCGWPTSAPRPTLPPSGKLTPKPLPTHQPQTPGSPRQAGEAGVDGRGG